MLAGFLFPALLAACNGAPSSPMPSVHKLPLVASTGSAEPHLARAADGSIVMSWLEPDGAAMRLRAATLRDDAWQTPITVASGDNWFVNWADFPSVEPIDNNLWAAHWLVRTPGGSYSYDVAVAISNDAGRTWSEPLTPHDDGTASEHGFVTLFPWQGAIGALWLDGRNMAGDGHGDHHSGGMTLRSAVIGADGGIISSQRVDELVCDCCQTDVALGQQGPIAVYRNRSESEIRDIHVVRAIDGQWQTNTPVADDGWTINACPVNGPAIASRQGKVAVAWFTAANNDSKLLMAWSNDDGRTFGNPIAVDIDRPVGRTDIELLDDGSAVVSWLRSGTDNHGEICLRQVSESGKLGPVHVVASTGASRASGFPQMLRDDAGLVIAWTDVSSDTTQVLTARVDAANL
jgi:hypothetical protein